MFFTIQVKIWLARCVFRIVVVSLFTVDFIAHGVSTVIAYGKLLLRGFCLLNISLLRAFIHSVDVLICISVMHND